MKASTKAPTRQGEISAWLRRACLLLFAMVSTARAEDSRATFADRTSDLKLGIDDSAACWADFDSDGWVDLCAGGIWRNDGGKGFSKLAEGVGCAVAADMDNDGFVDLFSCSSLRAFRNEGGRGFVPVEMPALPRCASRGACWGDLDGDAFVDLYIGGYEDWDAGITYPDMVLMNDKGKGFRLAWSEVRYRARGVTACDFDRDGDLDVYVSNYRLQPNLLWLNDGTGKLRDVAEERGVVATSPGFAGGHSIGAAWGDFDADGWIDLFAGNFAHVDDRGDQPKSRFLRNLGPGKGGSFEDRGPCGVHYQESYASPAAGDFDDDGDLDLWFTTVYGVASFGRPNHAVLFRNDGGFTFADATASAGLAGQPPTYQAAWADFDRDGDLDLATAGKLFENQGTAGTHWLEIRLEGDGKTVNRSAVGAQVRVRVGDRTLTRQVAAGTGEGNQDDLALHFGLGTSPGPSVLEILWPGGKAETIPSVEADRVATFRFGEPRAPQAGGETPK